MHKKGGNYGSIKKTAWAGIYIVLAVIVLSLSCFFLMPKASAKYVILQDSEVPMACYVKGGSSTLSAGASWFTAQSNFPKANVNSVTFAPSGTVVSGAAYSWDASAGRQGTVTCYAVPSSVPKAARFFRAAFGFVGTSLFSTSQINVHFPEKIITMS